MPKIVLTAKGIFCSLVPRPIPCFSNMIFPVCVEKHGIGLGTRLIFCGLAILLIIVSICDRKVNITVTFSNMIFPVCVEKHGIGLGTRLIIILWTGDFVDHCVNL